MTIKTINIQKSKLLKGASLEEQNIYIQNLLKEKKPPLNGGSVCARFFRNSTWLRIFIKKYLF